jgi:mRNA interferase HigB
MKVLGKPLIEKFCRKHADATGALRAWVAEAENWQTPQDIKNRYSSASFLPDGVVIFNIKGNNYRLEVRVVFAAGIVRILEVNTHADYDKKNKKRNSRNK